jgi:hypothetical protein
MRWFRINKRKKLMRQIKLHRLSLEDPTKWSRENKRSKDPLHYPPIKKKNYSFEEVTKACEEIVKIVRAYDDLHSTSRTQTLRREIGHVIWKKFHYSN